VIGQFFPEYLNNHSLRAGYKNYILRKNTIANKLNHAKTRTTVGYQ